MWAADLLERHERRRRRLLMTDTTFRLANPVGQVWPYGGILCKCVMAELLKDILMGYTDSATDWTVEIKE